MNRILTYLQTHRPPWVLLAFVFFVGNLMVVSVLSVIGIEFVSQAYTSPNETANVTAKLAESGFTEEVFISIFDWVSYWITIEKILLATAVIWDFYKMWRERHLKKKESSP